MTAVNDFSPVGHLPYLLDLAHRRMQLDLAAAMKGRDYPELRGSHFRLLSMIPAAGARPSALAETAQVTRPALGEMVQHLQSHGYVQTAADASDGRAVIVTLTTRGRRAARAVDAAIVDLRRRWADEIGETRLDALLDALAALTIEQASR